MLHQGCETQKINKIKNMYILLFRLCAGGIARARGQIHYRPWGHFPPLTVGQNRPKTTVKGRNYLGVGSESGLWAASGRNSRWLEGCTVETSRWGEAVIYRTIIGKLWEDKKRMNISWQTQEKKTKQNLNYIIVIVIISSASFSLYYLPDAAISDMDQYLQFILWRVSSSRYSKVWSPYCGLRAP